MAKQPYIPFYIGDYIRDTRMLPLNVRGAWVDIILQSWDNDGEVTGTMEDIGRMISCSTEEAILVIQKLKQKLIFDWEDLPNGEIKIICRRIKKMKKISETRKLAGIQGGNPNLLKQNKKRGKPKVKQNPEYEYEYEYDNKSININDTKSKSSEKAKSILPFDTPAFCEAWKNWIAYRAEIGKPYKSIRSEQTALKSLSEFDEDFSIELIERSISNQWQGLVFEKTKQDFLNRKKINGSSSKFDRQQQIEDHNADQLRRIMAGGLRNSGS